MKTLKLHRILHDPGRSKATIQRKLTNRRSSKKTISIRLKSSLIHVVSIFNTIDMKSFKRYEIIQDCDCLTFRA